MNNKKKYSFSGPHKVRYGTPCLDHNRLNRLMPSKYERIASYNVYASSNPCSDVIIEHHSFFWKLWFFIKSIFNVKV